MKGITGGVLGPTGPTPVLPTAPSCTKLFGAYHGIWLKATTGTVYWGGSSGGLTTGAGMALNAVDPTLFLPFTNRRELHVLIPVGSAVRWSIA